MTNPEELLILVDFDGTITQNDVGALIFDTFAKEENRRIVSLWLEGKISSRECLERLCQLVKVSRSELKKFVLSQKIDEKFCDFVDLCKCKGLKLVVLSDGLDFYIKLILKKFGLERLPFYSNVLKFKGNKLEPRFPYFDKGCGSCGNCKRYHLISLREKGQTVVYVGDGLSDKCAVREADLVFAKGDLSRFCEKEGIGHYLFSDFGDVSKILRKLLKGQRTVTGSSKKSVRGE
jgi:2-hydroxy-3-keto-5-methylthiopentenyl-1-phosphate phosphatase